jgi:hypothetical protein
VAGRRIFVGDIQGCREPLERLLAAVDFSKSKDTLLPVGDLVEKGPDSPGVLRLLRRLDAQPVLGNHDLRFLQRGGHRTSERTWLEAQPIVRQFDDLIMVHAGLHPLWQDADLENLTGSQVDYAVTVRYCTATGGRPPADWPPPGPPYQPWDSFYQLQRRVVFGHWARRGLVKNHRVIGLDTGCCYGNQLTAWIAEQDEIVQVAGQG